MGGQPLVVIRHPLADNRPDEVSRKAAEIVDEVVSVLTEPADRLAERYRDRYLKLADRRSEGAAACTDEACVDDADRGLQAR